jgi:two-component system sensor histidine kinase UhpB
LKTKLLLNHPIIKKAVHEKNDLVKGVAHTLNNGFFSVDKQWTVKYWNKAAEELMGVKSKDIIGKNLQEKCAKVIPSAFNAVYEKAFLSDIPLHFEEHWGEMGSWFDVITYYCDHTLSVSFKSGNQLPYIYPVEQVDRLKNITELYKFVTAISNDCLWEWNLLEAEIFWIDGGHKRMFGYQVENALIQQSFWESRLHPEDRIRVLKKLNETVGAGKDCLWNDEYRFARADGTYAYVHDRGHIICNEGKAYKMIGATQDLSEQIRLQKKLDDQKLASQREITAAILTAYEVERMEIANELHENLNQVLAVTKIYIQLAKKNTNKIKRDLYLEKSAEFVTNVMKEINSISKTLVPPSMDLLALSENIKILLNDFKDAYPITIEFEEEGSSGENLDKKLQLNILRIIQEQLRNISKHSKATYAVIKLTGNKNEIRLSISDNGKGCDITKVANGNGIRNIIIRAELYKGTATFVSKPGKGYSLTVSFPIYKLK